MGTQQPPERRRSNRSTAIRWTAAQLMTLKNRKLEKEENEQKKLRKKIKQSYQEIKNFKGKKETNWTAYNSPKIYEVK